jgi:hypothetical protein
MAPPGLRVDELACDVWVRCWHAIGDGCAVTHSVASPPRDHDEDARRWAEARSRFWTELRRGEREPEVRAQRPRRYP